MDNQLENKIWQLVDGDLSPDQQSVFLREMNNDPLLVEKYHEIKSLHKLLSTPTTDEVPGFLADNIMQAITTEEIDKELVGDALSLQYIPYIIGGCALVLTIIVTVVLLIGGIKIEGDANSFLQVDVPAKTFHYMGYLSFLTLIMIVFYKYSVPGFHEKLERKSPK